MAEIIPVSSSSKKDSLPKARDEKETSISDVVPPVVVFPAVPAGEVSSNSN